MNTAYLKLVSIHRDRFKFVHDFNSGLYCIMIQMELCCLQDSGGSSSDSDEDKEGNYSTLRELLIRPSHKSNSNGSRSASPANTTPSGGLSSNNTTVALPGAKGSKKSRLDTLDEVISSVIEHSVQKEEHHSSSSSVEGKPPIELKHFVRRYNWAQKGREPLPIRIMTLTESKILYPDVPHSWLCDGKLLRLNDPNCDGNYRIFQVIIFKIFLNFIENTQLGQTAMTG